MSAEHKGPPLTMLAAMHLGMFVGGAVVPTVLNGGVHFPMPTDTPTAFFAEHHSTLPFGAVLLFASAIPLLLYSATAASRLTFFNLRVAGVTIALVGGVGAALMQAFCALLQTAMAHVTAGEAQHAMHWLAFLTGGVGTVVFFGLLIAGLAVTAGLTGLVPKWLALMGVVLAFVAELSTLVILAPGFVYLIPLARFGGGVWLVIYGALLPHRKRELPAMAERSES